MDISVRIYKRMRNTHRCSELAAHCDSLTHWQPPPSAFLSRYRRLWFCGTETSWFETLWPTPATLCWRVAGTTNRCTSRSEKSWSSPTRQRCDSPRKRAGFPPAAIVCISTLHHPLTPRGLIFNFARATCSPVQSDTLRPSGLRLRPHSLSVGQTCSGMRACDRSLDRYICLCIWKERNSSGQLILPGFRSATRKMIGSSVRPEAVKASNSMSHRFFFILFFPPGERGKDLSWHFILVQMLQTNFFIFESESYLMATKGNQSSTRFWNCRFRRLPWVIYYYQ